MSKPSPTKPQPHRPRPLKRVGAARVIEEAAPSPKTSRLGDDTIVEHPDGWFWLGPDHDREFGPFESREAALADRDRWDDAAPSDDTTVQEAEREIGIADWIDAETGEPAEGQTRPHFEER
jgi:hypothetical protein